MNQLMSSSPMMTSVEVAGLVESRHDSVRRTIERLAERAVIELPPMVEVKNHLGQGVSAYVLEGEQGKRDSYVIVAQLSPEFTARLVDRWQELEERPQPAAVDPIQVLNDPVAMRGLLLNYSEKVLALQEQVDEQAPTVAAHERIASADGVMTLTEAAKSLQVNPSYLIDYMLERRWLYRAGKRGRLQAYQPRLDRGHLRHKLAPDNHRPQVMVTIKGVALLSERIEKEQMSGQIIHAQFGSYRRQAELL